MRQRQMNAEVTARLRELQTTIEAGAPLKGHALHHFDTDGRWHAACSHFTYVARVKQVPRTPLLLILATLHNLHCDAWSVLQHASDMLMCGRRCRRAPQGECASEHRGQPGGLGGAGQAREGRVPHAQQVQRGRHAQGATCLLCPCCLCIGTGCLHAGLTCISTSNLWHPSAACMPSLLHVLTSEPEPCSGDGALNRMCSVSAAACMT